MATVTILKWSLKDVIEVDKNNVESKIENNTIINPKTVTYIRVELLIDGERHTVQITPPYSRAKLITAIRDILTKRNTDEGITFEVNP